MSEDTKPQPRVRKFSAVCPKCNSSQVFEVVECSITANGSRCNVSAVCSSCKKGTKSAELSRLTTTTCPKKNAGQCKYKAEQPDEGNKGGFFSWFSRRKK